jgi:signal transduction histidine kinase
MSGSGIVTTLLAYLLYQRHILQRLGRLRWVLVLLALFTTSIVLLNVWTLARLMFVDQHYVSLTTTILIFAGLMSISFSFFVSKAITDRLSLLAQGVKRLAQGELSTRLDVDGNDEIAELTQGFNQMAHSLQEVDEQKRLLEQTRRDLIAWVSHDLRTPLASMRVMLEALSDGIITDHETQQRYMQQSLHEIEHLSALIEDLFEMAQLDVGHSAMEFQPASIRDLISDTLGSMMPKAEQKDIQLNGTIADDVDMVDMAPDKIQRVLSNIVNNAILYTPKGEHIKIHAFRYTTDYIQIDIHNTGTVIDAETLPHIFESFYRGERSRMKNEDASRGTGLGLAIARGLVEAHGGKIWATSSSGAGTRFCIQLPEKHISNIYKTT